MIQINDDDLPIDVAQKIIKGVKPSNASPMAKALAATLTGNNNAGDQEDMFTLEEIKEIADYLTVYYENHKNGD